MLKSLLCQTLLCLLLSLVSAQIFTEGSCSAKVSIVKKFNVQKYMGKWYEYAKYPNYYENYGKCIIAEYQLRRDGLVNVKNSMINKGSNNISVIVGNATLVENGKLLVKFPVSLNQTASSNYWVLDTDYKTYSVVYSCDILNEYYQAVTAWILTRDPLPHPNTIRKAIQVFRNNRLSLNELDVTNHIACGYL